MKQIDSLSELKSTGSFQLSEDVYMSDSYSPLEEFNGVLDGNNYTIYNLQSELFKILGDDACIKNLTIKAPKLSSQESNIGLILENNGVIKDVTVVDLRIDVKKESSDTVELVGGLVSDNKGKIKCCSIEGSIKGSIIFGGMLTGRSAIDDDSTKISNTTVSGFISGVSNIGGITGNAKNTDFLQCKSSVIVQGKSYLGGLCGNGKENTYTDCQFTGSIEGLTVIGGIAGSFGGEEKNSIKSCTVTGTIKGKNDLGGFVGSTIKSLNCYGSLFKGELHMYSNQANGILVGKVWDDKLCINNCTVAGKVYANKIAGVFSQEGANKIEVLDTIIRPIISSESDTLLDTEYLSKNKNTINPEFKNLKSSEKIYVDCEKDLRDCSSNATIYLTEDISLTQNKAVFETFSGSLHGNGHTITGVQTNLINFLRETGEIINLNVANGNIDIESFRFGVLTNVNKGIIKNCILNNITIKGSCNKFIGGLVGINEEGSIHEIKMRNMSVLNPYTKSQAGILTSHNAGLIEECEIDESCIIGCYLTGGISSSSTSTIRKCRVKNTIVKGSEIVGGLVGGTETQSSVVKQASVNNCTIRGQKTVGGAFGKTTGKIYNINSSADVTGDKKVGGFAGTLFNTQLKNCKCRGSVTGNGFASKCVQTNIKKSYTTQNIKSTTDYSTFIYSVSVSILHDCFSLVNIPTSTSIGLFMETNSDVKNCFWYDKSQKPELTINDMKALCLI